MTNAFRGCITSKPTSEKSHFSVRQMGPDDGEICPGDPTLRALQGRWGWGWGELPASPFLPSSWVPPVPLRTEEERAAALWFPHSGFGFLTGNLHPPDRVHLSLFGLL